MEEKEIEKLIFGMEENEGWKILQEKWTSGVIVMPQDEVERRKEYRRKLKEVFLLNDVKPENINDQWLVGKVRRILAK